jgi:mannose/fructose/N-acetylgalactosamine-specific phosphotransferase system component IIC
MGETFAPPVVLALLTVVAMADLNVFVFQCADTDLYGLSLYSSGGNLPVDACAGAWHYRGRLLMTKQSLGTLPIDVPAAMAELRTAGLFLIQLSSRIILLRR